MSPLVPVSVTSCHSSYEPGEQILPLMFSRTDMSFLKIFFSRLINSNLFTLSFIAYACFSLKPPVTLHHSWLHSPKREGRNPSEALSVLRKVTGYFTCLASWLLLSRLGACRVCELRDSMPSLCHYKPRWSSLGMLPSRLFLICCVCHWLFLLEWVPSAFPYWNYLFRCKY